MEGHIVSTPPIPHLFASMGFFPSMPTPMGMFYRPPLLQILDYKPEGFLLAYEGLNSGRHLILVPKSY